MVASCGYDITETHPHFLDPEKGYARKYEFQKTKPKKCGDPNFFPVFTGSRVPIQNMSGYVCFPLDEAQRMYSAYLKDLEDRQDCNVKKASK